MVDYDKKPSVIWDIDNCLSDDHWRQGLIDWEVHGDARYQRYNAAALQDQAKHASVFELFRRLGALPVFFTGRPQTMAEDTKAWLTRWFNLDPDEYHIYFRPLGSKGLTPKMLKEQMLLQFLLEFKNATVIAAFDDIPAIITMYRAYDIPAARLAIHSDLAGVYEPADLV